MASFGSTVTTIVSRITVAMLFPLNVRALLAAKGFTVCRLVHRMQHHRVHIAGDLHVPEEAAVGRDASRYGHMSAKQTARVPEGADPWRCPKRRRSCSRRSRPPR